MKDIRYGKLLKESFDSLTKNFSQIVIYWLVSALLFLLLLPAVILAVPVFFIPSTEIKIILFAILGLISLLGILIIGSMSGSLIISMLYDLARGKKLDLGNIKKYITKYWKNVFQINIFIVTLAIASTLVVAIIIGILYLIHPVLSIIAGFIFLILLIGITILAGIFLIFLQPTIAVKKGKAMQILRETIQYTQKEFSHAAFTWLIVVLIGSAAALLSLAVTALISMPIITLGGTETVAGHGIIRSADVITNIISSFIGLWLGIFTFKSFLKGKSR